MIPYKEEDDYMVYTTVATGDGVKHICGWISREALKEFNNISKARTPFFSMYCTNKAIPNCLGE